MTYAFRNTGRILLLSPFSSQNVPDVIKNIQEFQSEEIVKLEKPQVMKNIG